MIKFLEKKQNCSNFLNIFLSAFLQLNYDNFLIIGLKIKELKILFFPLWVKILYGIIFFWISIMERNDCAIFHVISSF